MNELKAEQQVQKVLVSHPAISTIIEKEPVLLDVLKLAASQSNRAERWQMYETLKYVCSQFVGWYAANPAIKDSGSCCQIIEALDLLLPMPEIDEETQEDVDREMALQQLRDGILRINPTIKLPKVHKDDKFAEPLTLSELIDKYILRKEEDQ